MSKHPSQFDEPTTPDQAYRRMMDWAEGRRSWVNLGHHAPYTPDVIAVMDAAEVQKWSAVFIAMKLEGGDDE